MDPVLKTLEHYRLTACDAQKTEDLRSLEEEFLSDVDTYEFVDYNAGQILRWWKS